MSGTVNKVILIGNLGADPETKHFPDGNSLTRIAIATSETYTNRENEKVTATEWHNITLRKGLSGVAEKYLKKGDKVYIEGKLKTRSWDDNGVKKYATDVVAENMTMLTPRSTQSVGGQENMAQEQNTPPPQNYNAQSQAEDSKFAGAEEDEVLPF